MEKKKPQLPSEFERWQKENEGKKEAGKARYASVQYNNLFKNGRHPNGKPILTEEEKELRKAKAKKKAAVARKKKEKVKQVMQPITYHRKKDDFYVISKMRRFDFLKFWSLVRHWAMAEWSLTSGEIDTLLYLYSETAFTKAEYEKYADVLIGRKNSLNDFLKKGYLEEIPLVHKETGRPVKNDRMFKMTFSMASKIAAIYDRLLLKTEISELPNKTKIFRKIKGTLKDKKVAKLVQEMNQTIREIQKDAPIGYIRDDFRQENFNK